MCLFCLFWHLRLQFPFCVTFLIWISFVAFLYGGLPLLVPSCPFSMAFLPVPNLFTSSGVFGVYNLCFSMSASIWPFLSYVFLLLYSLNHFALVFFWPFLALISWPLYLVLLCSSISHISVSFWPLTLGYFVYINIFIIWYLLAFYINIHIRLCAFFGS